MLCRNPTLIIRLSGARRKGRVDRSVCSGGSSSSGGSSGSTRLASAGSRTAGFALLLREEGFEPGAVDEVDGADQEGG
jgi:hypothetical protein